MVQQKTQVFNFEKNFRESLHKIKANMCPKCDPSNRKVLKKAEISAGILSKK